MTRGPTTGRAVANALFTSLLRTKSQGELVPVARSLFQLLCFGSFEVKDTLGQGLFGPDDLPPLLQKSRVQIGFAPTCSVQDVRCVYKILASIAKRRVAMADLLTASDTLDLPDEIRHLWDMSNQQDPKDSRFWEFLKSCKVHDVPERKLHSVQLMAVYWMLLYNIRADPQEIELGVPLETWPEIQQDVL
jgi:hypothetical protein